MKKILTSQRNDVPHLFIQRHQADVMGVLPGWDRLRLQGTLRSRATQKLELKLQWGQCIHLYFYLIHEPVGWLSVRLQTWFPFLIQVCLNGPEWLARQMDAAGLAYRRADNCFPWVADGARAQALLEEQHRTDWPKLLRPLVELCHPLHTEITRPIERDYYWTAAESEFIRG